MKTLALSVAALAAAWGCNRPPELACPHPGDICTLAGTGTAGFGGDEGDATQADLYLPQDLSYGPDGNPYILDWNNHRIRSITPDGLIHTIAGTGILGDTVGDADGSSFNHPTNIAFDPEGRMVVAAWHNSKVKRVDLGTKQIVDVCGTGKRAYSGDDGPAAAADLDLPAAVAFDAQGNLFVMDQANQVIRKIDRAGVISRIAGQCVVGTCPSGQTPVRCPGRNDKTTCQLDTDPTACSRACAPGFSGDNGPALTARMAQSFGQAADPAGRIAFDPSGNLHFADTQNHRIRKIDQRTGLISTLAGTGVPGADGDEGPASAAQLNHPADLAFAPDGTLYIADTFNSCIRSVGADGIIHTVVGTCGKPGSTGDGASAERALLSRPYGLTLDPEGALVIADTYNHRIRRVRPLDVVP